MAEGISAKQQWVSPMKAPSVLNGTKHKFDVKTFDLTESVGR